MAMIAVATPVSERLLFNSGVLDLSTYGLVDVENVTVDITFAEKELRRLNSIKMGSHKRATFKCGFKAKVKSMSKEALGLIMGTSGADTPSGTLITVKDGQVTSWNAVLTTYVDDDPLKPIQFQFTDCIAINTPVNSVLEDFGTIDLDVVARDVAVHYYD
jgi:hypothetical protein